MSLRILGIHFELVKVIQKIRDRLTNDNNKDWDFWLTQPPYLQPFTEFSKKLAIINERIKNRPSIPKLPDGPIMNEWFYLRDSNSLLINSFFTFNPGAAGKILVRGLQFVSKMLQIRIIIELKPRS